MIQKKYKKFEKNYFKNNFRERLQCINDCESFENVFVDSLNKHASSKKSYVRVNHVSQD